MAPLLRFWHILKTFHCWFRRPFRRYKTQTFTCAYETESKLCTVAYKIAWVAGGFLCPMRKLLATPREK